MKLEWRVIMVVGCSVLAACFVLLGINYEWRCAIQWLIQAGLLWAWVGYCCFQRLALNRADEISPLYLQLGWANRATMLRGGLIAMTGGFVWQAPYSYSAYLPALAYSIAAILDRLDGYLARRCRQTSLLGRELDTIFDALGLVVAPLLAVSIGKLHGSFLSVSLAYYVFQWGLQWRRRNNLPVYDLMPNFLRRTLAGFQMGFVAAALWPMFPAEFSKLMGIVFMLPLLVGFIVDWLVVSGGINSAMPATQKKFATLQSATENLILPASRLLLFIMCMTIFAQTSLLLIVGAVLGLILVGFGIAGRLGALMIVVLLSQLPVNSLPISHILAVLAASTILLLGTGRFSLWQWDDYWVKRYDGA